MQVQKINFLNAVLILSSCAIAFKVPFELFMFSYAVLGPLHYLTEINWLHDRKLFTDNQASFWWLTLFAFIWFLGYLIAYFSTAISGYLPEGLISESRLAGIGYLITILSIYVAFVSSYLMVGAKKIKNWYVIASIFLLAFLITELPTYLIIIGFIPNLIHVIIFTGTFMLWGALKGQSASGLWTFLLYVACTAACVALPLGITGFMISDTLNESFMNSGLREINSNLVTFLTGDKNGNSHLSDIGIKIQRLIAFCYTYHYLNWFSKTSIIEWHKTSKVKLMLIIGFWIISVGIYTYSFKLGVLILLVLSIIHVMYEFPLNQRSFLEIPGAISRWRKN
ncbi:MAG: hypothetical protein AAF693_11690 [Bacteroidota bacterium]